MTVEKLSDSAIIDLYLARDEEAIRQTDLRYGRRLRNLSNRILGSQEDADESISETYWKAWNSIPPECPEYLFAFLAQICRNISINSLKYKKASRRNAEIVALTQEMESCIPDGASKRLEESQELRRVLNDFLTTLSADSRKLFLQRYWYSKSIGEISRDFGLTESAVYTRLCRIRKQLKHHLKQEAKK